MSLELLLCFFLEPPERSQLTRAVPPVGGNVAVAPNEVTIKFSEQLEPAFSTSLCGIRSAIGRADIGKDGLRRL